MNSSPADVAYPRIIRRIQATLIDTVVIPWAAIGMLVLVDALGAQSTFVKIGAAILIILLLDPLAVAFTGGTVGHHFMGMRVRRLKKDEHLHFIAALMRAVIKILFGLPSFLVALVTRRRQALHDVVSGSLVVYKSAIGLPAYEVLPEITREIEQRVYASVWKRLLVIMLYWSLCFIGTGILFNMLFSRACVQDGRCGSAESLGSFLALALLLLTFVAIAILGWRGVLYGCRKRAAS